MILTAFAKTNSLTWRVVENLALDHLCRANGCRVTLALPKFRFRSLVHAPAQSDDLSHAPAREGEVWAVWMCPVQRLRL